jgi:CubicO group peptidase (beta-lactamase class C family)
MMRILIIIFIGLFFTSCIESNKIVFTKEHIHSKLESKIDSLFNIYYIENGPAAAILISYEGKNIVKKAFGLKNITEKEIATIQTNFRSGSLAKQFTALGILGLVEEGKIQLSDTVANYFPYSTFENITIQQLISHTSGLQDAEYWIEKNWQSNDYVQLDDIMNWYETNDKFMFEPGTSFEYNNGAYYVLVKIIEVVSGTSFSDYMQKIVFDKIGMNNTKYVNSKTIGKIPNMAICYEKDSLGNWKSEEKYFLNSLVGAGGIYTNLVDYSKYLDALRKSKIFNETTHQLVFKPISMNIELHSEDMRILKGKESSYAMGWEVTDSLAVSAGLYYGVNNWLIYEFDKPLSLIILTNSNILFKEKLVDKTYDIINDYFKTTANN